MYLGGWSDTELADAFAAITLNTATSYFTHYAGPDLDLPPAPRSSDRAGRREVRWSSGQDR